MCASDVQRQTEVKGSDRTKASTQVGQALLSKGKGKKINILLLSGPAVRQQYTHSHLSQAAVVRLNDVSLSKQFTYSHPVLLCHEMIGTRVWVSEVSLSFVRGSHNLSVLLPIVADREALQPSGETLLPTLPRLHTVQL